MSSKANPSVNLRSYWARIGGALIFTGGLIFFIFNTIAQSIYPGYNVGVDALSKLGAIGANTRFLWDGQLFVNGALSLVGMILLFYMSSSPDIEARRAISVLFILPAIGAIVVSLCPENLNITIHTIGAFVTFVFGALAAIYAGRFIKSPFRYFSIVLGLVSLISLTQLSGNAIGFGDAERLVVYPIVLWQISFGTFLMQQ